MVSSSLSRTEFAKSLFILAVAFLPGACTADVEGLSSYQIPLGSGGSSFRGTGGMGEPPIPDPVVSTGGVTGMQPSDRGTGGVVPQNGSGGSVPSTGGASFDAGSTGGGGTRDGGASDLTPLPGDGGMTSGDGGTATWSDIYTTMLNNSRYASNCTGGGCHNPGTARNIRLATSAGGYTSIRALVTPGSATAGTLIRVLTQGSMPQGRPRMPTADLDRIKAWIVAGALNN